MLSWIRNRITLVTLTLAASVFVIVTFYWIVFDTYCASGYQIKTSRQAIQISIEFWDREFSVGAHKDLVNFIVDGEFKDADSPYWSAQFLKKGQHFVNFIHYDHWYVSFRRELGGLKYTLANEVGRCSVINSPYGAWIERVK